MKKGMAILASLLLVVLLVACNGSNEPKATLDKYNQIEIGMTREQINQIMGFEGTAGPDINGSVAVIYRGDGVSQASVTFFENKVTDKLETGLK